MSNPDRSHLQGGESFSPTGTWALLCLIVALMVAAWLFLYFGVFVPRGAVN